MMKNASWEPGMRRAVSHPLHRSGRPGCMVSGDDRESDL